jgi:hypothetical protein
MLAAAREQVRREAAQDRKRDQEYAKREYEELRAQVDAFEKASGVHINRYDGEKIGEAVAVVRRGGMKQYADDFRWMVERAERLHAYLQALKPLLADTDDINCEWSKP